MKTYRWHWFKILVPALIVISIIFIFDYLTTMNAQWQALRQQQLTAIHSGRRAIVDEFASISADMRIFSSAFTLYSAYDSVIIKEQFINLHRNKPAYDQIRFLDLNGDEKIRVNRRNGKSVLLRNEGLQNKANRYYFSRAENLRIGEIYISPLDLNMEDGKIEYPIKPTIRLITSVYNWDGKKVGFVIINYLAQNLIDRFIAASSLHQRQLFLINQTGKLLWMKGVDDLYQWSLDEFKNFNEQFPDIWLLAKTSQQGQVSIKEGYYTFTSLKETNGKAVNSRPDWILVSLISKSELNVVRWNFLSERWKIYIPFLLLSLFISFVYSRIKRKHQHFVELHRYEQRFRQILEGMNLASVIIHQDGRISYCNSKFIKLIGYSQDQLIDRPWLSLFMQHSSTSDIELFQSLFGDDEIPHDIEHQLAVASGEQRTFSWSLVSFTEPDVGSRCLTLIGSDITEQRAAERQIERLSHVVEQSPISVMVTSVSGEIDYVNPEFTNLTGYRSDEVVGLTPAFLQSGLNNNIDYSQLWATISAGKTWHGEFCNRKKNRELYWESAAISPLKNEMGEILAYIALKQDITEQKRLESELECQRQKQQRQAQDAAVGKMAYMIAHDLRNPLSSVKMTMQMLPALLPDKNSDLHELATISLEQIQYMEEILTSLLVYSRADEVKCEWLDIGLLITNVITTEKTAFDDNNTKIKYIRNNNLPFVFADNVKLQQVLQNLISNAVQAAQYDDECPEVRIIIEHAYYKNSEYLRILISNNGKSIDPCVGHRIFEPFFTTKAKGTGLGLAIVKKNIEFHRGEITLSITQPTGTLCTVLLPVDHTQAVQKVT